MAVAGIHNVSVLDSSFLGESQSGAARRRGGEDRRVGTRASLFLQRRQESDDNHVVSNIQGRVSERLLQRGNDGSSNGNPRADESDAHSFEPSGNSDGVSVTDSDYEQWSPGPIGSETGQDDSSDLGEAERERVRQIFREWMNTGPRERTSSISQQSNGSRAEWLGENEQGRVRIIREWVQMNSRQRGACPNRTEEQGAEVGGQIEQVLDGLVVNQNEGQSEHARRGIRRLCGRQALLDMVKKAVRERQTELHGLMEHRAVTQFSHRNRIQSLLRGRFLRNDGRIGDNRPTSIAARELGVLRQRHTVSDLREGFVSRSDHSNSVCPQISSDTSETLSNTDISGDRNEQTEPNNPQQTVDNSYEETEQNTGESNNYGLSDGRIDTEGSMAGEMHWQEPTASSEDGSGHVPVYGLRSNQRSGGAGFVGRRNGNEQEANGNSGGVHDNELYLENRENEFGEQMNELSTSNILSQHSELDLEENAVPMISDQEDGLEGREAEDVNLHEFIVEAEQPQNHMLESEESSSRARLDSNRQGVGIQDNLEGHRHENNASGWLENEEREASEAWNGDGLQEAVQSWLGEPSDQEAVPAGRASSFYVSDDDNVYSMELRELVSRRSVSTLLHSGFRESLDQLVRSYVERQNHAPLGWELQGTSPVPESADHDFEQQDGNQNEDQGDAIEIPLHSVPSPSMPPVQQLWEQEPHNYSWSQHEMHPRFGIEWDVINDLRIDMARLQQRMNNIQRMMEACMDMQLELQRSIRQEVSAALNRSASLPGTENSSPEDRCKWDNVRKGMCCMCSDGSIDSLLYRCGHMCTCSKCANELVQRGEKCPMCRAPVVEVIRAYSIQ